jgi:lipopolysaccharide export system permease protein
MVLYSYLIRRLLRGYLVVLASIAALIWLLELLQMLEDAPNRGYGVLFAAWQATRAVPESLLDLMPVASVLATAWIIGMMNRDHELTAMRAFGLSLRRLSAVALVPGVLFGLTGLAVLQWATPVYYAEMDRLLGTRLGESGLWHGTHGLWMRDDERYLNVGGLHLGRTPQDVSIYHFDDQGRLEQRISAAQATILSPGEWSLEQVRIEHFLHDGRRRTEDYDRLIWDSFVTGQELERFLRSPASLPVTDLWGYVADIRARGLEYREYEMVLWRRLSLPLASIGMVLVAMGVAGPPRSRVFSIGIAAAIGIGLAYLLLAEVVALAGLTFTLPAMPMALAPVAVLIVAATLLLRRVDTRG